jgi:rhodanese-related sulfurtransferase
MDRLIEFASHHPWLVSAAIFAAALVATYEMRLRGQDAAAISPQELIRLMNQGALVLDIRPPEQYAAGHINGARQMASDQILKAGDTLKRHKEKPVVVYCDGGSLAHSAVRQLAEQGFTKAVSLRGGLGAWRAENLPLAKT